MRLRLGLLQDPATMEKQAARAAAEAQAKKLKSETPTAKTEAQMKADETAATKEKDRGGDRVKSLLLPKHKIRPLSEAKAIDSGASFVSEGFLMMVGVSLILLENWRTKRRETTRREDVADRISELEESERTSRRALVELETEILRLRRKSGIVAGQRILPEEMWEPEAKEGKEQNNSRGWLSWIGRVTRFKGDNAEDIREAPERTGKDVPPKKSSTKDIKNSPDPELQPRLSVKSLLHLDSASSKPGSQQTEPTN